LPLCCWQSSLWIASWIGCSGAENGVAAVSKDMDHAARNPQSHHSRALNLEDKQLQNPWKNHDNILL
jgi:hypothetical protein